MFSEYERYIAGLSTLARGGIGVGIMLGAFVNFMLLLLVVRTKSAADPRQGTLLSALGACGAVLVTVVISLVLAGAGVIHAWTEFQLNGISKGVIFPGVVPMVMAVMALWTTSAELADVFHGTR